MLPQCKPRSPAPPSRPLFRWCSYHFCCLWRLPSQGCYRPLAKGKRVGLGKRFATSCRRGPEGGLGGGRLKVGVAVLTDNGSNDRLYGQRLPQAASLPTFLAEQESRARRRRHWEVSPPNPPSSLAEMSSLPVEFLPQRLGQGHRLLRRGAVRAGAGGKCRRAAE